MFRKKVILTLTSVEREYRVARLAVSDLLERATNNPTILYAQGVVNSDVRACRANSEITYLVRMFAVFEEALRDVRRTMYRKNTAIKTYDLLQQCAARQGVPDHLRMDAHNVREFRNTIVHGGDAPAIPVPGARSSLCAFLGWMPPEW